MSFIHYLAAGFFDHASLRERRLVVVKPMPDKVVADLLATFAAYRPDGSIRLNGLPVRLTPECITCVWVGGRKSWKAEEFCFLLKRKTGCDVVETSSFELFDFWYEDPFLEVGERKPYLVTDEPSAGALG